MKKMFYALCALVLAMTVTGCLGNNVEDKYKDERNANLDWYNAQKASGEYTTIIASWDPMAEVLMKWYNDTMLTKDNYRPLFTSTVDVKYKGCTYDGTPFDSSYLRTSPADSIYRDMVSNGIEGWAIALMHMHVGDSCHVIIPYAQAYGATEISDEIIPYSMLQFDIKLVSIYAYETK